MSEKTFKIIRLVLFLVIVGLIWTMVYYVFVDKQHDVIQPGEIIKRDSVIFIDTVKVYDTIDIPRYIPRYTTIIDTNWVQDTLPVDILKTLKDYFNKNVYIDTIVNDSNILVIIIDTVCRNKIQSRNPFIVSNYKQITIDKKETIYLYPKNEYFIGGYAGKSTIGAEFMYRRNKNMFGAGFGTNGFHLKYARKLSKK